MRALVADRIDALHMVASFTKIHFAYVAKYMRAVEPVLHTNMRRSFGIITDALARCGYTHDQLRDLRIVVTKGPHMPSDEPPEIVANIRPDGTMDTEDASAEILRWHPQPVENTTVREYVAINFDDIKHHAGVDICTRAAVLYDDIERIEGELRWLVTELLVSHRWDQALRVNSVAYTSARANAINKFGSIPRGDEPARAIAAMARMGDADVLTWLKTRTRSNQFVYTCMRLILNDKNRPALTEIVEKMKDTTLSATRIQSDLAPAWGIHPCTKWMSQEEFFIAMGWDTSMDIDLQRGNVGVILCMRGYGANITTDWTEAMKPNKPNEGLTKPFMRKQDTVTVNASSPDRGYEIYGKDEQEWLFIEVAYTNEDVTMRMYNHGTDNKKLQRSDVAFALDGVTNRMDKYAQTVHSMDVLQDHAMWVTQFLAQKPPLESSEKIQVDVRIHITQNLPKLAKWNDFHEWIYTPAAHTIIESACVKALPPTVLQADSMASHTAHVYWCARELIKSIYAVEPREQVPDNMFTDALAAASVKEVLVRACERVDNAIGWVRERTFTEYLRENTSILSSI